jgi:hypothetical protein
VKAGSVAMRPWGPIGWVVERLRNRKWSLLGCIGAEERSLGVWEFLRSSAKHDRSLLVRIRPSSTRYAVEIADRLTLRLDKLRQIGDPSEGIVEVGLFATDAEIVQIVDQFATFCGPHVVVDFSCFPKRFFFPFVKRLLAKTQIETLVGTYTVPEHYFPGVLAEDHQPFAHLPLFGPSQFPEAKVEMVIVTAGFVKLGLTELLEPYKTGVAIRTILPFPPGLPAYHRNWEFIREMQKTLPPGLAPPIRIQAYDCADTFDYVVQLTAHGTKNTIFAPFGPKPLSLAICLFASLARQAVYYTQPTVYNPDYSTGIRRWNGKMAAYAYTLRVNGNNTYSIS